MSPQVCSTAVSTKTKNRFDGNISLPWYRENSRIHGLQKMDLLSSEPGGKLFYWAEVGHLHVNWPDPIPAVLYPSIDENLQIDIIDSVTNRLENFLAERFFSIPEVEYVFLSIEKDSMDIWTVINKLDREIRKKIYDVEYDILDIIKGFEFDFHVICRNNRTIEELYPSNARMIFQR
jgi:hypothetical protein